MRVIVGKAKGHKLKSPKSNRTRPALDQVKEAVFNILFDVEGMQVLDLFAGCGSVGIEALSRGAKSCIFVEDWSEAIKCIDDNLIHCKCKDSAKIMQSKVDKAINYLDRKKTRFDLIFVDPPYEKDLVNQTLTVLSKTCLVDGDTRIIVEHHPKEPILDIKGLTLTDSRKYGQTLISFLEKTP